MHYKNAITRTPCPEIINGITSVNLGMPDYEKALLQHQAYVKTLENCGVEVLVLAADNRFPDSTFVEDVALHTPKGVILSNPGALSRQQEITIIESTLLNIFGKIDKITSPGTLEPGDVLQVENTFYIGRSERTNEKGAQQLITFLEKNDLEGIIVPLKKYFHLKTGVSNLGQNNLLVSGELVGHPAFEKFNQIVVDADEEYAANSLNINGKIIMPQGFPKTYQKVHDLGYEIITIDMSEFQKVDGGLSCLSIRY